METSAWVRDVDEESFERDVLEASEECPVIVDFWSPTCGPCRTLGPILERLVEEREGKCILAKVNVQDHPNLAAYFRINAIPDVKVISERRLLTEFQGLLPEEQLRQLLDQLVGPMADPEVVNAMAAEESSPARAEQLYREKVAAEPDQLDARVGLARVLLLQGKLDEIASILEPVGASGDLGAESEAILARAWLMTNAKDITAPATPNDAKGFLDHGACLAAKGELEQALPALLRAAELDFKLATGKVREVMVKVFYALGTSHPLANEYRSKLSRLLY